MLAYSNMVTTHSHLQDFQQNAILCCPLFYSANYKPPGRWTLSKLAKDNQNQSYCLKYNKQYPCGRGDRGSESTTSRTLISHILYLFALHLPPPSPEIYYVTIDLVFF